MNEVLEEENKVDMTPMIDVVFLLLVYFMITTQLKKQEADLSMKLPTQAQPKSDPEEVSKHVIEILGDGSVLIDNAPTGDSPNSIVFEALASRLDILKAMNDRTKTKMVIMIIADDFSMHEQSIKVINACRKAKIEFLSFRN